jgi:transposase
MPECSTTTFQIYLDEFSTQNPNEFKIIVLDNGAFHKAKALRIPNNIGLIFLPPYSPELNPAENMWQGFKRNFTGKLHKSLDEVSQFISNEIKTLTKESIRTTCAFSYIFAELNWTM